MGYKPDLTKPSDIRIGEHTAQVIADVIVLWRSASRLWWELRERAIAIYDDTEER